MSHCGYFVTTFILVTSGLLSIGSSMEKKICFNFSNQHICYFQPKEALTWIGGLASKQWEKAWNICQRNNATLPIIENQEVQNTFEEYLRNISLNTNGVWLSGRQEEIKKWLWSNNKPFYQPDLILDDGQNWRTQAVIGRSFDSESPSNATLRYAAVNPSWPCYYICQYSASQCPADNSTTQIDHQGCLKVFRDWAQNVSEATKDCNKTGGGHLAIFDGDEFLTKAPKVYQQMHRYRSQDAIFYYCIGLHRIDTKSWFWMRSNNENSTMEGNYNNWSYKNNRGDGDCLFATANDHRWKASRCDFPKHFICQTIETLSTTTKEDSDSSEMNDPLLVYLIGAIAGIAALFTAALIIIVLLRRHRRKADVAKSPKMSASCVKPKAVEKSDNNSPAVYEEIQLKTTEEEDKAQQTEATVYAVITASSSDRNHNRSSQQQGNSAHSSDTGVVYAAVEFTNDYN